MGIIEKIRRHAAVARGDFDAMFKDLKVPPLPAAVNQLVLEINQPEPDIDRIARLISSSSSLAAKTLKTVNSSLYALRLPVADIRRAVTLLGIESLRSIILGFATMDALPQPRGSLFDPDAFWVDSLLQAILARTLAHAKFDNQLEEVFSASLLADLAVPVLLCVWNDYYEPIVSEWNQSPRTLSQIERDSFGWDHGQASAWIIRTWKFPEDMVCYVGLHNMPMEKIKAAELDGTIVVPMAIASIAPSILKPDAAACRMFYESACEWLSLDQPGFIDHMRKAKTAMDEITDTIGVAGADGTRVIDDLIQAAGQENAGMLDDE